MWTYMRPWGPLACLLLGCAADTSGAKTTQAWDPDGNDGSSGTAATSPTDADGIDEGGSEASAGDGAEPTPCDAACESPPSDCHVAPGECVDGACTYAPALAGTPCTSGCAQAGFCDAAGTCICADASCADTCVGGPNMNAACDDAGECIRTCTAPFEDCDGDPANGCEVPVGMPHQCGIEGLVADGGCWTAYCGEAQGDGVFNFGTYHCVDCSTCAELGGGQCHWCNHDDGSWYPAEACACGSYLDAVCG